MRYLRRISEELDLLSERVKDDEISVLAELILGANRVFLAGAGRSGLMIRAFAMRLMHMGLKSYVVGDVLTPGIAKGDTLIIGSGSGETASLVGYARKAKEVYEAKVALITIAPLSTIGKLSDVTVVIPAPSPKAVVAPLVKSSQPMGTLFEQELLLALDATVMHLMDRLGIDSIAMFKKHANLE